MTGGFGEAPKVKVDSPWAIDKTRTKVLDASNGPVVSEGQGVEVNYYGVNGRTGKKFDESFSTGSRWPSAWRRSFQDSARGWWATQPVAAYWSPCRARTATTPWVVIHRRVSRSATLIFVVDLVDVQLAGPEGKVQPKEGPTVTETGARPEITIPESDPPTSLRCSR